MIHRYLLLVLQARGKLNGPETTLPRGVKLAANNLGLGGLLARRNKLIAEKGYAALVPTGTPWLDQIRTVRGFCLVAQKKWAGAEKALLAARPALTKAGDVDAASQRQSPESTKAAQ